MQLLLEKCIATYPGTIKLKRLSIGTDKNLAAVRHWCDTLSQQGAAFHQANGNTGVVCLHASKQLLEQHLVSISLGQAFIRGGRGLFRGWGLGGFLSPHTPSPPIESQALARFQCKLET